MDDLTIWRDLKLRSGTAGAGHIALFLLITALPLAAVVMAMVFFSIPAPLLFRDLAAVSSQHPFVGGVSMLGLLAWAASSAIWLNAALYAGKYDIADKKSYAAASLLTAYLAIDDAFMLHEQIIPQVTHVSEKLVLLTIAVAALTFIILARTMLLRTPIIFIFSVLMLPLSMVIDALPVQRLFEYKDMALILEDVTKWVGIIGWMMTSFWHFNEVTSRPVSSEYAPNLTE